MLSSKNLLRIVINTGIGLILVFIWLKLVNINEIIVELNKVNFLYVLPFGLFFILSNFFRSIRLKILLSRKDYVTAKISLKNVYFLNHLSQLLSFTIPIRAGEISKAVYLSSEFNLPFARAFVWILMDRFLDFWILLILSFFCLFFVTTSLPGNLTLTLFWLVGFLSLGATLVIYFPNIIKKLANLFLALLIFNIFKKIFLKMTHFLIDSVTFLKRDFQDTSKLIFITILAFISDGLGWLVLFNAVFDNSVIDLLRIFLGSLLSSLTFILPAAPGYIGSAEASGLAVFSYGLGYNQTLASVVVLINHILTLLLILILGLTSLYILNFKLSLVWKKIRRVD